MADTHGAFTVHVKGYREVTRALNKVDKGTRKALLAALKRGAEPVAQDARQRLSRYPGLSTATIAPRAVAKGVYVTQKRGKKTGTRPDFGSLQMRVGLIPAAAANEDHVRDVVDDAIGKLIKGEGF